MERNEAQSSHRTSRISEPTSKMVWTKAYTDQGYSPAIARKAAVALLRGEDPGDILAWAEAM